MSHDVPPLPPSADDQSAVDTSPDGDALTERQHNAINLLLQGAPDKSVAAGAGVCRRTLYRWKNEDEAFMAELHRRRTAINDQHSDRLRAMLGEALDVLDEQMKERYGPVCHRAARTVLTLTGLGKTLGLKPNVGVQAPKAPLPLHHEEPEMSMKTMRALVNAVKGIDLFATNNRPNASQVTPPKAA
jgi:hypothetical protein